MGKEETVKPRQKQAIETKNKIQKVALQLINRRGFNDVTIREICEAADVSIGTFYHHYRTKSDIFNQIFKEGDDYFEKTVLKKTKDLSVKDAISVFFQEYAAFLLSKDFDTIRQLYFSQSTLFIDKNRSMNTILTSLIKTGIEEADLKTSYFPDELSDYYFIIMRGIVFDWCLHEGRYDLKEKVMKFLNLLDSPLFNKESG